MICATAGDGPVGVDLHACLLKRQAAPAKSVLERDRNWTYAEFVSHAQQAAEYFRDNRIERVLIHLPQGFNAYVLIWAAYLAGTAFCTVGDNTPPIRRQRYLEAFQPDLVISEEQFGASTTPSALFDRTACCTSGPMDMASYLDPDATAYVLFTSGSTGRPKGVMISRRSLEFVVAFALREYAVDENDVWAQYSSIGFDLSVLDVFTAIAAGAAVVPIVSQGDRLMPARLIALHSITIWHSVPSAFELLDHSRRLTAETLAPLRLIIFCGEPLYPTLIAKIFTAKSDLLVYNTYGPTEATIFCTCQRLTAQDFSTLSRDTVAIGRPIPGVGISLDDSGDGVGELVISGTGVGKGYLGSTEQYGYILEDGATQPKAYRTGDFCRFAEDALYFVCRRDRQVKISGNRVDLSEVDLALREAGCEAAVSVFDGQRITSFVLCSAMSASELRQALSRQLPAYYLPAMIHICDSLPYSQSGKIDIARLLEWAKSDG